MELVWKLTFLGLFVGALGFSIGLMMGEDVYGAIVVLVGLFYISILIYYYIKLYTKP